MAKVVAWTQAYNAEHTLRRTMDSILNQSYDDLKYYVVDNGSVDGTWNIIREYAEKDSRVIPLHVDVNNIQSSSELMPEYLKDTEAKYFFWCDADDEYKLDFLENTIGFAETENLDLVACGYEQIDAITGEMIKCRELGYNLVITGKDFKNKFIEYRGFTIGGWGKLISIPVLFSNGFASKKDKYVFYGDCEWGLQLFLKSERVGIYKKAEYKYYIYPKSLSKNMEMDFFDGYESYWMQTKAYIHYYGRISKKNKDFLYAIYLSLMEERLELVYASQMELSQKLFYIDHIFSKPLVKKTFIRKADSQFRNLAAREQFITNVIEWINEEEKNPEELRIAEELIKKIRGYSKETRKRK